MAASLSKQDVKAKALELGADLVGIAAAEAINAHPPDPAWPQTPGRIWHECRSVISLACHVPVGMYRAQDLLTRLHVPQKMLSRVERVSVDLALSLERAGYYAIPAVQEAVDTDLKRGSYGSLSMRHLAVEAGLGTLGLNMNIVTPQYGPRVYLGAVLTNAAFAPDGPPEKAVCLGPSCGRCLLACPSDSVLHWGNDKRRCSQNAQRYGLGKLRDYLERLAGASGSEERAELLHGPEIVNYWQALRMGYGAYGGCPRCVEVCPVGDDYRRHLKDVHGGDLPEDTPEKRRRLGEMVGAERSAAAVVGLARSSRWIGKLKTRRRAACS